MHRNKHTYFLFIGASVHLVDIRGRSPIQLAQSKLRILQRNPDVLVKSKVTQVNSFKFDRKYV